MPRARAPKPSATAKDDATPLVVVTLDGGTLPDTLQVLAAAAEPALHLVALTDIEEGLETRPGEPLLVVLSAPAKSLLSALQAGTTPSLALAHWKHQAETHLAALRKARRRIIALDRDALSAGPQGFAKIFAARLDADFSAADFAGAEAPVATEPAALALMAVLLLESDPHARALADELEATLVCPPAPPVVRAEEIDRAFAAHQAQTVALATVETERDLLREDLAQMQEQLERSVMELRLNHAAKEAVERQASTLDAKRLLRESVLAAAILKYAAVAEERVAEIAAQKAVAHTAATTHAEDIAALKAETQATARTLGKEIAALKAQAQATAKAHAKEVSALQHELKVQAQAKDAVGTRLDQARVELEAVYASPSWKVTSPMRTLRRGLGKR